MSDFEIKWRFGLFETIKWKLFPGETIVVDWPEEKEFVAGSESKYWYDCGVENVIVMTDDPNYHYRPALEKTVGKQGKDWMWRAIVVPELLYPRREREMMIEIKIHKRRAKWASILLIQWRKT